MKKKIAILVFLVIFPNVLGQIYDNKFRYAGNWLEDYQNYFKLGFLIISILASAWLLFISKKDKSYIWLTFSVILLILLLIYLYFAVTIINTSF
jgi:predicted Na+-dependent transporter